MLIYYVSGGKPRDALSCRASLLAKTVHRTVFDNSTLAERPPAQAFAVCGQRRGTQSPRPQQAFEKA